MKLDFSHRVFKKALKYKFHKNPPSESRVVPCGRTDGHTEMTNLIVALRSFANAPNENEHI
jgi:hypothetical protein